MFSLGKHAFWAVLNSGEYGSIKPVLAEDIFLYSKTSLIETVEDTSCTEFQDVKLNIT